MSRGRSAAAPPSISPSRAHPPSLRTPPVQMPENTRIDAPGSCGCPLQWRRHSEAREGEAAGTARYQRQWTVLHVFLSVAASLCLLPLPRGHARAPRPAAPAAATPEHCRRCRLRRTRISVLARPPAACGAASAAAPPLVRRWPAQRRHPRRDRGQCSATINGEPPFRCGGGGRRGPSAGKGRGAAGGCGRGSKVKGAGPAPQPRRIVGRCDPRGTSQEKENECAHEARHMAQGEGAPSRAIPMI